MRRGSKIQQCLGELQKKVTTDGQIYEGVKKRKHGSSGNYLPDFLTLGKAADEEM